MINFIEPKEAKFLREEYLKEKYYSISLEIKEAAKKGSNELIISFFDINLLGESFQLKHFLIELGFSVDKRDGGFSVRW